MGSMQEQMNMLALFAMPLLGGAVLAYGLYQLWNDLRKPEHKRLQKRLKEQTFVQTPTDKTSGISVLRTGPNQRKKLADALLSKYGLVKKIQNTFSQAGVDWSASR